MSETPEQAARDMLERMGVENAQRFTTGDVVELANLTAKVRAFTWDDVDLLREAAHRLGPESYLFPEDGAEEMAAEAAKVEHLAERIAALLPPREPGA